MDYRVLCDENVPPETVAFLEEEGHDADHVGDALSPGVHDPTVATHVREEDYLLSTNDADFLDADAYPGVTVLYVPDNRTTAYELAARVDRLASTVPDADKLPRTVFLTEER